MSEAISDSRPFTFLHLAPVGCPLRLIAVHSGKKLAFRLAEMGLTPGTKFSIVQKSRGPILLSVRGSRIALGKVVAQKIEVLALFEEQHKQH